MIKIYNIFTNEESSLPKGKADLLLASSVDKTIENKELLLTPTINAEFITNESLFSLATAQVSIPTVVIRAIHNLNPFSSIEVLDLGLEEKPQNATCHNFNISSLDSPQDIFEKGMIFGKTYELKGNYLILGANRTNELADIVTCVLALDFESENKNISNFEKLSIASANMMFCSGFLLEATRRFHVVLSGGVEIAVSLFIADRLREDVLMRVKHNNITFATTQWNIKGEDPLLLNILSQLSYTPDAIYTSFDFSSIEIQEIKEYNETQDNSGINIGAALAYGVVNEIEPETILNEIEIVSYSV